MKILYKTWGKEETGREEIRRIRKRSRNAFSLEEESKGRRLSTIVRLLVVQCSDLSSHKDGNNNPLFPVGNNNVGISLIVIDLCNYTIENPRICILYLMRNVVISVFY